MTEDYTKAQESIGIRDYRDLIIIKYDSGIGTKSYGFRKFHALKINLAIGFIRKMHW